MYKFITIIIVWGAFWMVQGRPQDNLENWLNLDQLQKDLPGFVRVKRMPEPDLGVIKADVKPDSDDKTKTTWIIDTDEIEKKTDAVQVDLGSDGDTKPDAKEQKPENEGNSKPVEQPAEQQQDQISVKEPENQDAASPVVVNQEPQLVSEKEDKSKEVKDALFIFRADLQPKQYRVKPERNRGNGQDSKGSHGVLNRCLRVRCTKPPMGAQCSETYDEKVPHRLGLTTECW